MELWDKEGRLEFPKSKDGRIQRRRFFDELKGKPVQSLWDDIEPVSSQADERLGYPTQKPEALMERVISASSNPGDTVLDPFCGCGTTVAAAEKLHRRWIGIDITFRSIDLIQKRITDHYYGGNPAMFKEHVYVHGVPQDVEGAVHLARQTDKLRKEFEKWACTAIGGVYQEKKGADGGMDGFIPLSEGGRTEQCIIQVKSGGIGLKDAKELNSTIDYFKARCGVLFTIESPTKPILEYVAGLPPYRPRWGAVELESVPRIQVITAAEHFAGVKLNLPGRVRLEKEAKAIRRAGPAQGQLSEEEDE